MFQSAMPEQAGNRLDVCPIVEDIRGERVAGAMEQNPKSTRQQTSDDKTQPV